MVFGICSESTYYAIALYWNKKSTTTNTIALKLLADAHVIQLIVTNMALENYKSK